MTRYEEIITRLDNLKQMIQYEQNDARVCLSYGMLSLAYSLTFLSEMMTDNDGLNIHLTTHKGK